MDTAVVLLNGADRAGQPHRLAEPPGQAGGHLLVAASHPPAWPPAEPRGRVLGHGGSELAGTGPCRCLHSRQVARQGGGLAWPAGGHLGEGASRGGCGRRRSYPCSTLADLCCADWPAAAWLTVVVGHHCACQFQVEFGQHLAQHVVAIQHELGASLDDGPPIAGNEFLRPHPATHPVACLKHHNLATSLG